MPYCSVLSCRHQSKFNNLSHGGISYHRFPHDPDLKERWIDATGRQNWMPTKLSTICSEHFAPHCFIVKQCGYRYLSDKAVPTLNFLRFYVENQANVKDEPSSDSDSHEGTSRIQDVYVKVKVERNTNTDVTNICNETSNNRDGCDSSQNDTPKEERLKTMLRGKTELVRRQRLKIKQLQSKLRRLSKRYTIVEGELKQRKIEDDQMGITREKYVYKDPEETTRPIKREEFEFVRV